MKKTLGIIGMGEVGQAIKTLAKSNYTVYGRDLTFDELADHQLDILHICVPFNETFIQTAIKAIHELKPSLVIIDATVAPGTTRTIYEQTKIRIAHCPIMGVHPHLAEYQQQFTKAIGAINDEAYDQVKIFWQSIGVNHLTRFDRPEETEIAKLLCTTYYGWNILFNKLVHNLCVQHDFNFDQVYTEFNRIYNDGYAGTLPHVRRPNLNYVPGPIGGHCVIPNLRILATTFNEPIFGDMLELNETLQKE